MDKKLAKEFVAKVYPLEHSHDSQDRKTAVLIERRMKKLLKSIPAPRAARLSD